MYKKFHQVLFAVVMVVALNACIESPGAPTTSALTPAAGAVPAATTPHFSQPTAITHAFYPVAQIAQAIWLGTAAGEANRVEATLLPENKRIHWRDAEVETRVVQVIDYRTDMLVSVADHYFAQADDGSVYALGADVSNYAAGQMVDQTGSWLAGLDGATPILMMPAQFVVGSFYTAPQDMANPIIQSCAIVTLAQAAMTPAGPTDKGVLIKETLADGTVKNSTYAESWGMLATETNGESLALVLLNRSAAQPGALPTPLVTIEAEAEDLIDFIPSGNWGVISKDVTAISTAWQNYQSQLGTDHVPAPFVTALEAALAQLQTHAAAKATVATHQAANDVSAALMDLMALYQPTPPVDLGRLDVLGRQVILDVGAADFTAAANTLAKSNAIWARLKPIVLAHDGAAVAADYEASLATQADALHNQDVATLTNEATAALELVDDLEQLF
ncbi:MAG: hypothetical protein R3C14_13370 [Caldilineaceae bacterium]